MPGNTVYCGMTNIIVPVIVCAFAIVGCRSGCSCPVQPTDGGLVPEDAGIAADASMEPLDATTAPIDATVPELDATTPVEAFPVLPEAP